MRNPNQLFVKCTPFFLKCIAYFIHVNNTLPISPFTTASHVLCATTWLGAGHSITYYGKSCVGLSHAPHARAPFTCPLSPSFFVHTTLLICFNTHSNIHTHTHTQTHNQSRISILKPLSTTIVNNFLLNDGRLLAILLSVPACLTHYVSTNNGQQQFPPPPSACPLSAASSHTKQMS